MTDINYTPDDWPENIKKLQLDKLVGSKYTFPDGDSIEVTQIKLRDKVIENKGTDGIAPFVTYKVQQGPGIPRMLGMFYQEFIDTYGHLFPNELGHK
jgi:hypothetical protein|tara:strand:- start:497 stop:787 length:291 start_codon:yes stop_codon:yes gene_type:complete